MPHRRLRKLSLSKPTGGLPVPFDRLRVRPKVRFGGHSRHGAANPGRVRCCVDTGALCHYDGDVGSVGGWALPVQ